NHARDDLASGPAAVSSKSCHRPRVDVDANRPPGQTFGRRRQELRRVDAAVWTAIEDDDHGSRWQNERGPGGDQPSLGGPLRRSKERQRRPERQIGRASCRERAERSVLLGYVKRK